jgi:hypothetical protein
MGLPVFPTKGPQKTWELTEERHAKYQQLFPGRNLELEYELMLAWIEKNGPKTANGMNLFILNWLRKPERKAPPNAFSWNHDVLAPKPTPKNGDAERRRMELWGQFRAQGMTDLEAKQASYRAWLEEGWGK